MFERESGSVRVYIMDTPGVNFADLRSVAAILATYKEGPRPDRVAFEFPGDHGYFEIQPRFVKERHYPWKKTERMLLEKDVEFVLIGKTSGYGVDKGAIKRIASSIARDMKKEGREYWTGAELDRACSRALCEGLRLLASRVPEKLGRLSRGMRLYRKSDDGGMDFEMLQEVEREVSALARVSARRR